MVFGLVPDALDLMKLSRISVVNVCEHFVANLMESLEGFEPSTRCLEGSRSVQLSYRDILIEYTMKGSRIGYTILSYSEQFAVYCRGKPPS